MNKYGQFGKAAIEATRIFPQTGSPGSAWEMAIRKFTDSIHSREKGCPRSTFLGLCEKGLVKGVDEAPAGTYTSSPDNAPRAARAVRLLRKNPGWASKTPVQLWAEVMNDMGIDSPPGYDSQMHVVLTLWHAGMIADPE